MNDLYIRSKVEPILYLYKSEDKMHSPASDKNRPSNRVNESTKLMATILGIITGIGGSLHGFFEILKGNIPTKGIVLTDIGAITLIPNYLITGIIALLVGLIIIIWILGFIQKPSGPTVYLMLSILLFLVGGGIAQVLGIIITWLVGTRINKPLSWWDKRLSSQLRKILSNTWHLSLLLGYLLFFTGFGIWLFVLPPGKIYQITVMHYICWSFLIFGFIFIIITIICGFARDIEMRINAEK